MVRYCKDMGKPDDEYEAQIVDSFLTQLVGSRLFSLFSINSCVFQEGAWQEAINKLKVTKRPDSNEQEQQRNLTICLVDQSDPLQALLDQLQQYKTSLESSFGPIFSDAIRAIRKRQRDESGQAAESSTSVKRQRTEKQ